MSWDPRQRHTGNTLFLGLGDMVKRQVEDGLDPQVEDGLGSPGKERFPSP